MLSAEVPRAIGDYASRQLAESDRLRVAAENEADPARRDALINAANAIQDNWSEGGTYRVALHTLSGALSGNVSGALGSFMAASQIGILDDALSDMNADPTLREAVLLASSFMMGAATNGLQGAINTTGQTANNYLSHAQIDELQSKLTLCNGDKDCQLEAARQYEDISDSNLAQMLADCEQGGPECAAHSSAMQATQDYYRRAIYESSGFSRNVLLSFAVNDLLEQNVPASTVTGKQLEEYGFSPEVVSMAVAIIAGGRRPNSAKPDGAKPTSGDKTDVDSGVGASRAPWTQVSSDARSVARDIESATGRALPQNQRNRLAEQLREVDHRNPVSDADYANLQREYRRNRTQMIRDWENNTGQSWPKGAQLHHVIPQRYGGPNQWWNAHPAFPSQHQGGIHGTGSPTQTVFPTPISRQ